MKHLDEYNYIAQYPVVTEKTCLLPVYLDGVGINPEQEERNRPLGHIKSQFFIVLEGKGKLFCEGQEFLVEKGCCFFIEKNVPHHYYAVQKPFQTAWLTVDGMACESLFAYAGIRRFKLKPSVPEELEKRYLELLRCQANHRHEKEISVMLYEYMQCFLTHLGNADREKQHALQAAADYIKEHYAKDITLDELADACGMNKFAFCRNFKARYFETPFEYVLRTRISAAKKLLTTEKNMQIREIAERTGFHDTAYFCRTFKRFEKMSPGTFREI